MELSKKPLALQEVLESYKHIELTDDETMEAIIWRKQKKEQEIQQKRVLEIEAENRKMFTQFRWTYDQTKAFAKWRASQIFDKEFIIDQSNSVIFELLCYYFSQDERFVSLADQAELNNVSLNKGILLCGSYGSGKTWMMKLFQKNQRHCFMIRNAKELADLYEKSGEVAIEEYLKPVKNAINDTAVFYQPFLGLCIDDIGTDSTKVNFGNRKNVIGDIIEKRYAAGHTGVGFHCTTNLTAKAIEEFYGGRVSSRMREIFNIIELTGEDRRK